MGDKIKSYVNLVNIKSKPIECAIFTVSTLNFLNVKCVSLLLRAAVIQSCLRYFYYIGVCLLLLVLYLLSKLLLLNSFTVQLNIWII